MKKINTAKEYPLDTPEIAKQIQKDLMAILEEHRQLVQHIDFLQVAKAIPLIRSAYRIFVYGAGRSGLALKAAAMRYMHFGFKVYVVGETTTPAIRIGDLLIVGSGSGRTSTIVHAAEVAARESAQVLAFSTTDDSPLSKIANYTILLPAAQKTDHHNQVSHQYAGSLFEQSLLLINDAIIQTLWRLDGSSAEQLWKSHANLE
ncbi:3-hexulose-6-phosphate isomerase [bacterium A37T11]|nr:3-hexulose-6-phosphate isomerase [bacterium A37T11]